METRLERKRNAKRERVRVNACTWHETRSILGERMAPNVTKIRAQRYALHPVILRHGPRNIITRLETPQYCDMDRAILRGWRPSNIATWTAQYYARNITRSALRRRPRLIAIFSDPVILQLCLILVRIGHVVLDSDFVHVLSYGAFYLESISLG